MSSKLQPVRGTHDFLADDARLYHHVVDTARRLSATYGCSEIMPPVFEFSEVFHRTLGETSDVVSKETYTFEDRGGESITLRPEFTASIARAFISNGLQDQLPCKFFYAGPAFRYERPQKGRMRQFHQIGVEILGAGEVQADVEVIALAHSLLHALGLGHHIALELNSLGDSASRAGYREALVSYLKDHRSSLSEDSQKRLEKNPLRILDSKDAGDRAIIEGAPQMHDYFNASSRDFFAALTEGLSQLGIAYTVNDRLVRGLDYYSHTVFEFTTQSLGAQGTVLAGGRYDGLIELMGGSDTPGIGWAAGVERLMALLSDVASACLPQPVRPIVIIPQSEAAHSPALALAYRLRRAGFAVEHGYRGNMSKRMKKADKLGAVAALILGEDELKTSTVMLRDLQNGHQESVGMDALESRLQLFKTGV